MDLFVSEDSMHVNSILNMNYLLVVRLK